MIVRAFDEVARATDDSVQALTRKVALFLGDRFLITVHGKDHAFIDVIGNKHRESSYTQDLRHRPRADAAIA